MSKLYSTPDELQQIADILRGYLKLPFTEISVPGAMMEAIISSVRHAEVMRTYDFVDVVDTIGKVGWQVKSTKASTPLTWKRAKIRNRTELIEASHKSAAGLQELGDEIINFCNEHARESMEKYDLDEIGYARLVVHDGGELMYFERKLCSKDNPVIFKHRDYIWKWATPKVTTKKEQLPALHGTDKKTGAKVFAWHGLGENQLHYSGEKVWWPQDGDEHVIKFKAPSDTARISYERFAEILATLAD